MADMQRGIAGDVVHTNDDAVGSDIAETAHASEVSTVSISCVEFVVCMTVVCVFV